MAHSWYGMVWFGMVWYGVVCENMREYAGICENIRVLYVPQYVRICQNMQEYKRIRAVICEHTLELTSLYSVVYSRVYSI